MSGLVFTIIVLAGAFLAGLVGSLTGLERWMIYLSVYCEEQVDDHRFNPFKTPYSSILAILQGLSTLDGQPVIQFGILLLIFTPVGGIIFSIFSFMVVCDYLYVVIGLFVLCVILISLSNKLVG